MPRGRCFFSLDTVVAAMTTMLVFVQVSNLPTSPSMAISPNLPLFVHLPTHLRMPQRYTVDAPPCAQFIGQAVGLCLLRYRIKTGVLPADNEAWTIRHLPLIIVPQLTIFVFIFVTTDNWLISRQQPFLDLALLFLLAGALVFFVRQRCARAWPFAPPRRWETMLDGAASDEPTTHERPYHHPYHPPTLAGHAEGEGRGWGGPKGAREQVPPAPYPVTHTST